jgi:glycosyltransferase involved in cell wall biosynthesis
MNVEKHSKHSLRVRVLFIGTMSYPIGGIRITNSHLLDYLKGRKDVELRTIDTSRIRGHGAAGVCRLFLIILQIFLIAPRVDVISLHARPTAFPYIGPVAVFCSFVWRKPLIVRAHGGINYAELITYAEGGLNLITLPRSHQVLSRFTVSHADLYLTETKERMQNALDNGIVNVSLMPTNRPMDLAVDVTSIRRTKCRHFVYIGHIRPYKSIPELIRVFEEFESDIHLDVYGPFFDQLGPEMFEGSRRVSYKGVLQPDEVVPALKKYDAVLLISKAVTEGYPGLVLESYSAGVPVIATRIGAIPEVVNGEGGILIDDASVKEITRGVKLLVNDNQFYQKLCIGAARLGPFFSSDKWGAKFVEHCRGMS